MKKNVPKVRSKERISEVKKKISKFVNIKITKKGKRAKVKKQNKSKLNIKTVISYV